MSLTRRRLLQTGAAGVALLTLADCARRGASSGIDAGQREIVTRVANVMLDGALPAHDPQRAQALLAVTDSFGTVVSGLPPDDRHEVQQLFSLLSFAPSRRIVAGLPPWKDATPDEINAFLSRWRFSNFTLLRSGYDALHQLVMAAWYGSDAAWPRIGYPGPPSIVR